MSAIRVFILGLARSVEVQVLLIAEFDLGLRHLTLNIDVLRAEEPYRHDRAELAFNWNSI